MFSKLNFEQLRPLMPAILEAVRLQAPSGVMCASGVRVEGLRVLAKHRVREGVQACVEYIAGQKKHGSQKRTPHALTILESYGAHAQAVLPELERIAAAFEKGESDFPKKVSRQKADIVRKAIGEIRQLEASPPLISLER